MNSVDFQQRAPLPLDDAWGEIHRALEKHRNLVLVAEPGAGKTTRFPPRLVLSGLLKTDSSRVLMLEPRRLAARAAAHRIAEEQGWNLGNEVGYQVRFENRTSASTQLIVLTEGLLARKLQSDPELKNVGAVILDEFHERSLHTDLGVSLLFELQQLARPDLRIIVMSATLDAERASSYLGDCPVVRVPGRTFPVEVHHSKHPLLPDSGPAFLDRVSETAIETMEGARARHGDVLVFLPGAREIRGVRERVSARAGRAGFDCFELHGSLSLEDQDRAIRKQARSKIILATNIAETSLTIDGVGTVIDSGLARVMRVDSLGFPRLQLSRISLASATQRAGRAGRQGPGLCYRLWSKLDESAMPPFEQPEILRADLSEALMTLASQGVTDPEAFSWFEPPRAESLASAVQLLSDLSFRAPDGSLTPEGREALKLPTSVRLAKLLMEASRIGAVELGARIAALLSEKDIVINARELKRSAQAESDVLLRLHLLEEKHRGPETDRFAVRNVLRVADALASSAARLRGLRPSDWSRGLDADQTTEQLLLLAFPDRLSRRRRPKEPAARMVGGRGVVLAPFSTVETSEFFVGLDATELFASAASSTGARGDLQVTIASRVERPWIEKHFPVETGTQIVFDPETLSVQTQIASRFRDLPLEEPRQGRIMPDDAFPILVQAARERWNSHFMAHESLQRILERMAFAKQALPDESWPDLEGPERDAFLEEACFGETRLTEVLKKDLEEIYLRHLPTGISKLLQEAAPESLVVPSGSRIKLNYPPDRSPYLEVRIQEVFGLRESPRIAKGRVPVLLHLLGPNFRPVQVTADLESFWKSGYVEVRKELRARYPKHSWPEDPWTAQPEAKGRRRS